LDERGVAGLALADLSMIFGMGKGRLCIHQTIKYFAGLRLKSELNIDKSNPINQNFCISKAEDLDQPHLGDISAIVMSSLAWIYLQTSSICGKKLIDGAFLRIFNPNIANAFDSQRSSLSSRLQPISARSVRARS
jgi:hypothetical protein